MAGKTFALLVGIDEYPPGVRPLQGCVNDIRGFRSYLEGRFSPAALALEILENSDATRDNVIDTFRTHLGRAGQDDVALFIYCGHGARSPSAPEFERFYPDGKDEGLVCADSRIDGTPDLADKELAVLLHEVAAGDPHLAVILDCCHAGSATRSLSELQGAIPRFIGPSGPRSLDSYLQGYYSDLAAAGQDLSIPASRHVALAACDRWQTAKERAGAGVFSSTLAEVLGGGRPLTYAELFALSRVAVKRRAADQDPQFDSYDGFNAYEGFLGGHAGRGVRATVSFEDGDWTMDRGAFMGLPNDPAKPVHVELYDGDRHVGRGVTTEVLGAKSLLEIGDEVDGDKTYQAEITELPVAPLTVFADGAGEAIESLRARIADTPEVVIVDESEGTRYSVSVGELGTREVLVLRRSQPPLRIEGLPLDTDEGNELAVDYMVGVLKSAASFERVFDLQNRHTRLPASSVDLRVRIHPGEEREYRDEDGQATIVYQPAPGGADREWEDVRISVEATNNHSDKRLHVALFHLSEQLGVQKLHNDPLQPGETVALYAPGADSDRESGRGKLHLPPGRTESEDDFRLLVSTDPIPHQLIEQAEVPLQPVRSDRGLGASPERKRVPSDWFTKSIRIRGIGQTSQVGAQDVELADGRVVVRGHKTVRAKVGLSPSKGFGRDPVAGAHRALEPFGFRLIAMEGERGGEEDGGTVLEITDIANDAALADDPLEIELDLGLGDDDYVLPVAFDGQYFHVVGQPSKEDGGRTVIAIDRIPDSQIPDGRRSLGQALKLYLLRSYLARSVDKLRWVEFGEDGSVERHDEGIAQKVKGAASVLLLVHGIIGDTLNIAEGVGRATTAEGTSLRDVYDLVLTFDYENLGRGIEHTSELLGEALRSVGFGPDDGTRLTILSHSMGGLVSRHLIERGEGDAFVDHLVMCGTPNGGSPFGKVGSARSLLQLLTATALNVPGLAAFGAPLAMVLTRSMKVTVTLEQMNARSGFLTALNDGPRATVPYTVLAGNLSQYRLDADGLSIKLLNRLGGGLALEAMHGTEDHDIAVSRESIRGVEGSAESPPVRTDVACHHLNYFSSEAGLRALSLVEW